MTIEEKVRIPHVRRIVIWSLLILAISAVGVCYHHFTDTQFAPAATAACIVFIAAAAFYFMGIWDYCTDKSFSGKILQYKAVCRIHKISAFERRMETRIFVEMTVECDDGTTIAHEEMLSAALSSTIRREVSRFSIGCCAISSCGR